MARECPVHGSCKFALFWVGPHPVDSLQAAAILRMWTKDTATGDAMSDLTEEQLRELRLQFYREPLGKMAVEAILKLKELGCDPLILHADVGRVVGYRSGNLGLLMRPRIQVIERRIKAVRRHLREAAREANRLRGLWGFRGRMLDAGCFHATEELADIEKRFSKVNVKGYADWHPQREAILDLLDQVAKATGRYHYAEVSTIINAETAWRAFKRGEP